MSEIDEHPLWQFIRAVAKQNGPDVFLRPEFLPGSEEFVSLDPVKKSLSAEVNAGFLVAMLALNGESSDSSATETIRRFADAPVGAVFIMTTLKAERIGGDIWRQYKRSIRLPDFLPNLIAYAPKAFGKLPSERNSADDLREILNDENEFVRDWQVRDFFVNNPPETGSEFDALIEQGRRYKEAKQKKTTRRRNPRANETSAVLKTCWLSHALWARSNSSILTLFPNLETGSSAEDFERADNRINATISKLGLSKFRSPKCEALLED